MTGSAPDPADRTRRFLRRIGADEAAIAARAPQVVIELTAARLDPATEIALALTAILLVRLADFAPTIRIVMPRDRTVALPRLPDTPLPDALVTAHAGFTFGQPDHDRHHRSLRPAPGLQRPGRRDPRRQRRMGRSHRALPRRER